MFDALYSTEILTLSSTLKNERLDTPCGTSRKVSKLCGSWVEVDIAMKNGAVTEFAQRVQACALGQASAAILQQNIFGASLAEVTDARDALRDMLKADGEPPQGRFENLKLLAGVKAYPARYTSTLLAFEAAVEAMEQCSATQSGA